MAGILAAAFVLLFPACNKADNAVDCNRNAPPARSPQPTPAATSLLDAQIAGETASRLRGTSIALSALAEIAEPRSLANDLVIAAARK